MRAKIVATEAVITTTSPVGGVVDLHIYDSSNDVTLRLTHEQVRKLIETLQLYLPKSS
jgi:hypothetical protein